MRRCPPRWTPLTVQHIGLAKARDRGLGLELVREIVDNGRQEKLTWLLHRADAQKLGCHRYQH